MKPMTFEEWNNQDGYNEGFPYGGDTDAVWEAVWNEARIGMVPEDECVRLPKVEEWPKWAKELRVHYSNAKDNGDHRGQLIIAIPRPTPAWTPQVGERVFADDTEYSGHILVLRVHDIDEEERCEMVNHWGTWWHRTHLKPFDPAKIGLKWEEI